MLFLKRSSLNMSRRWPYNVHSSFLVNSTLANPVYTKLHYLNSLVLFFVVSSLNKNPSSAKQHLIHAQCPTLAGRKLRQRSKHNETLLSHPNGDSIQQSTEAGPTSSTYLLSAASYRTDKSTSLRNMMPLTFLLVLGMALSLLKKS